MQTLIKLIYNKVYGDRKREENILKTCSTFWHECEVLKQGENNG